MFPNILFFGMHCRIADWFSLKPGKDSGLLKPNLFKVEYQRIRFFTTENVAKNNIKLVTVSGEVFYDRGCLQDVIDECGYFVRISRQYAVNMNFIDSRREWTHLWSGDHRLKIGRTFRQKVKNRIEKYFETKYPDDLGSAS